MAGKETDLLADLNSIIDQAYEAAIENGALGGKIAGAGGGGFLLVLCQEEHQANVRRALGEMGIREMAFAFDFDGAHVVVNDPFIDGDEKCGMRWTFSPVSYDDSSQRLNAFEPVREPYHSPQDRSNR